MTKRVEIASFGMIEKGGNKGNLTRCKFTGGHKCPLSASDPRCPGCVVPQMVQGHIHSRSIVEGQTMK